MGSNGKQLGLGIGAALLLAFSVIWLVTKFSDGPVATVQPASSVPSDSVADVQDVATVEPELDAVTEPAIDAASAPAPTEPDTTEPQTAKPTFDTFQREDDGEALVAGRADPNAEIDVILSGDVIASTQADRSGAFVTFVSIAPSDQPRTLYLVSDPQGAAVRSSETIIVSPFAAIVEMAKAEPEPDIDAIADPESEPDSEAISEVAAKITPEPAQVIADDVVALAEPVVDSNEDVAVEAAAMIEDAVVSETVDEVLDNVVDTAEPATDVAIAETAPVVVVEEIAGIITDTATPAAPPALISDADGVRVLQPNDTPPEVLSNVALDAITYDPSGEVLLSGRASGGGFVQVYIDNKPITTSRIAADGNWRTDLPEVDTGVYTLRIDEVDTSGTVVSRVETPFKREEPDAVAAVLAESVAEDGFEVAVRTVQAGTTLWAIAREQFGEGIMYVEVFEANRDLIRDPNLIFPGQVFRMPEMTGDTGQ